MKHTPPRRGGAPASPFISKGGLLFSTPVAAGEQVCQDHPRVTIVTSEIDRGINNHFVVVPGVGEFGDRFFSS